MAMMCSALLACRSPPLLSRCRIVLPDEAGTGLTPQSAAKLASDRKRSGLSPAVSRSCAAPVCPIEVTGDKVGGKLLDDGADHRVEIGDLVMQFEIAAGKRFEADPIGGFHIADRRSDPAARRPVSG